MVNRHSALFLFGLMRRKVLLLSEKLMFHVFCCTSPGTIPLTSSSIHLYCYFVFDVFTVHMYYMYLVFRSLRGAFDLWYMHDHVCECVWSFSYGTRLSLLVLNIFSFLCVFWFFFSHLILLLLLVPLWPLSLPLPCRCNTWLRKWSLLRNIQHIVQMREIFFAMVLCLILFFFHTTSKRRICFIQQHKTPIGTMHYVYRTY